MPNNEVKLSDRERAIRYVVERYRQSRESAEIWIDRQLLCNIRLPASREGPAIVVNPVG